MLNGIAVDYGADGAGVGLVALSRSQQGSKPLVVRGLNLVDGTDQNLGIELPSTVGASSAVTARWDLAHGRLLIVAQVVKATLGIAFAIGRIEFVFCFTHNVRSKR